MTSHLLPVYQRLPIAFSHGQGVWLFDTNGKKYFDALCAYAVTSLGHQNPAIVKAIQTQAEKLLLVPNTVQIPEQEQLAKRLCELTGLDRAFIANSGAEAVEGLIKLARLYGHSKNIAKPQLIVMKDAFHGRTMATLTAGGNPHHHHGFEPLLEGFIRAPFNDIDYLDHLGNHHQSIVGILVEPIQGEGGIHIPAPGYLAGLRKLCDDNQWLLLFDEVQTGIGRTGKLYAYMHEGIKPDALSTAKALGAGIPISAFVMKQACADLFPLGSHGTTFGGNPMSCHVALTCLDFVVQKSLWENASKQGEKMLEALQLTWSDHPHIQAIRGKGLMIAIEFKHSAQSMVSLGLKHGLLTNVAHEKILRLLPPLIMNDEETNWLIERVNHLMTEYIKTC